MLDTEKVKISIAITPAEGVSASTDIEGAVLDMAGFDGVIIVVAFGPITNAAVTSIKAQQDSALAFNVDPLDLEGSNQTVADDDDNQVFYIDVFRPSDPFVRLHVDRATQPATVGAAFYVQYGSTNRPTVQGANVSGEKFVSPAEGAA